MGNCLGKSPAKSKSGTSRTHENNPASAKNVASPNKDVNNDQETTPNTKTLILGPKLKTRFKVEEFLGSGEFASVYLVRDAQNNNEQFAMKCLDAVDCPESEYKLFKREVFILRQLHHPGILRFIDYAEESLGKGKGRRMCLVTEYVGGGDLMESIAKCQSYGEEDARKIIKVIGSALSYIHDLGIVHRDLKPSNILVKGTISESNWSSHAVTVKLGDFGFASQLKDKSIPSLTSVAGTPLYVAPEIVQISRTKRGDKVEPYGTQVDMWSLGVLLYIMLSGYPPFYNEDPKAMFDAIQSGMYVLPSSEWAHISTEGRDLVIGLLEVDPQKRFTASQLLEHKWMSSKLPPRGSMSSSTIASIKKMRVQQLWRKGVWGVRLIVYLAAQKSKMGDMEVDTMRNVGESLNNVME